LFPLACLIREAAPACFRTLQGLLLLIVLLCVCPVTAQAQWACKYAEHDWRLKVAGGSYGLVQEIFKPGDIRTTTVFIGRPTFSTPIPAAFVSVIAVVPLGMVGLFLLTRVRRTV